MICFLTTDDSGVVLTLGGYVSVLRNAFTAFDHDKKGCLGMDMIGTILELLGHAQTQAELEKIIKEVDVDGKAIV